MKYENHQKHTVQECTNVNVICARQIILVIQQDTNVKDIERLNIKFHRHPLESTEENEAVKEIFIYLKVLKK